jgi:hypothetical protein
MNIEEAGSNINFSAKYFNIEGATSHWGNGQIINTSPENVAITYQLTKNNNSDLYVSYLKKDMNGNSNTTYAYNLPGIDKVYNVNDHVTFTCKPFSDGYLHIFQIIDTLSSLVFPNVYEKDNSVLKNKSIRFPRLNGLAYSLDQAEENNLIFVFTKKNIVFNNKETIEGIFEWIYNIKPDQRQIQIFNVIVK